MFDVSYRRKKTLNSETGGEKGLHKYYKTKFNTSTITYFALAERPTSPSSLHARRIILAHGLELDFVSDSESGNKALLNDRTENG